MKKLSSLFPILYLSILFLLLTTASAETTLRLPSSVTVIEADAFAGDTSLTDVTLPVGITEIGPRAFADSSLTSIDLPATLTYIAEDAFDGCPLATVYASEGTYAYNWAVEHGYIWKPDRTPEIVINQDGQAETVTIGLNEQARIVAPEGATATSAAPKIATVDEALRITGLAAGTTEITVRAEGITATITVTVIDRSQPTSISLALPTTALHVGDIVAAVPTILPETADKTLTWTSSNTSVATVADGIITARAAGSAIITAEAVNGVKATLSVTVDSGTPSLAIAISTPYIGAGESIRLSAQIQSPAAEECRWSVDNEKVAAIDQQGVLTGLKLGDAVVTLTSANGYYAHVAVTVVSPAMEIAAGEDMTLGLGECAVLPYEVIAEDGKVYKGANRVTTSDPAVVSLSDGRMTANGIGVARLTISAGMVTSTVRVTVKEYYKVHLVQSCAHRGAMGYWPENTLEAFRNTASTGADMVEFDVWTAKDGVQVVSHNASISVSGKKYVISSYTSKQLKRLKPDLCTMEEALDVLKDTGLGIQLELKDGANVKTCVDTIQRYGLMGRTCFISFNRTLLKQVRSYSAAASLGLTFNATTGLPEDVLDIARSLDLTYILPSCDLITEADILRWHKAGFKVAVWPLTTEEEMMEWIRYGVDGIASNYPDRIVSAREKIIKEG